MSFDHKLDKVVSRYRELGDMLASGATEAKSLAKLSKEYSDLGPVVAAIETLTRARADAQRSADRKGQVGTGDRSERIRTYNFPQGRVSDHRINLTVYEIDRVVEGELDRFIDALIAEDRAAKLAELA